MSFFFHLLVFFCFITALRDLRRLEGWTLAFCTGLGDMFVHLSVCLHNLFRSPPFHSTNNMFLDAMVLRNKTEKM